MRKLAGIIGIGTVGVMPGSRILRIEGFLGVYSGGEGLDAEAIRRRDPVRRAVSGWGQPRSLVEVGRLGDKA